MLISLPWADLYTPRLAIYSVNTICLGAVDTEAHDSLPGIIKDQMFDSLKQTLLVEPLEHWMRWQKHTWSS
ncbi:hypothetical protein RSAG8_08072, partial [Rhizoctonia solani AG-8 WAC10335]